MRQPLFGVADRLGAFGCRVLWYPDVTSTNDIAAALAESGAAEGSVVAADMQSAGRGRLGRTWVSPPAAGIYATVILRPLPSVAPMVTIAAGLAIAEGIETSTGLPARVKWPNDVFVEDSSDVAGARKVAGILAESGSASGGSSWVVLGFGINVLPAAYPPEIAVRATSIESELGRHVDRGLVFAECLAALAERYRDLQEQRVDDVVSAWRARASSTFGRKIEWDAGGTVHQGVAYDIGDDGALLVKTGGSVARVISGEVRWI